MGFLECAFVENAHVYIDNRFKTMYPYILDAVFNAGLLWRLEIICVDLHSF